MKSLFTYIFLIFFLTFSITVSAQNSYEYFGVVKLNGNDKTVITYRLNFIENDGVVKGYSVTDLGGNHETKNTIVGEYNKKTNIFNFKETDILYTKSTFSESSFCFVNFSDKVKLSKGETKIEGKFAGLYRNNKKCIDGTLALIGAEKINKMVSRVNNKIQGSKKFDDKVKTKYNPIKMLDSLKMNNLTANQNLNVFWDSDEFSMEVWDNGKLDDDRINIFANDKIMLSNYAVTTTKKSFKVNAKNNTVIKIEAINEGTIAPNTARIMLIDKNRTFELMSNLKKGESSSITIIRKSL